MLKPAPVKLEKREVVCVERWVVERGRDSDCGWVGGWDVR